MSRVGVICKFSPSDESLLLLLLQPAQALTFPGPVWCESGAVDPKDQRPTQIHEDFRVKGLDFQPRKVQLSEGHKSVEGLCLYHCDVIVLDVDVNTVDELPEDVVAQHCDVVPPEVHSQGLGGNVTYWDLCDVPVHPQKLFGFRDVSVLAVR